MTEPADPQLQAEVRQPDTPVKTLMDGNMTVNGVAILLAIIVSTLTIIGFVRKLRRDHESDLGAREEKITNRLDVLEKEAATFLPRAEIEGRVEHLRRNLESCDQIQQKHIDRHDQTLGQIQVDLGRVFERQASLEAGLTEVKLLIKELGGDIKTLLNRKAGA